MRSAANLVCWISGVALRRHNPPDRPAKVVGAGSSPVYPEFPAHLLTRSLQSLAAVSCKQKRTRRTVFNSLKLLRKSGAGEGIRTLDPNLGKVIIGLR